jgi:hypothetical protein
VVPVDTISRRSRNCVSVVVGIVARSTDADIVESDLGLDVLRMKF